MKKTLSDMIEEKKAQSAIYFADKPAISIGDTKVLSSKEKNIKEVFSNKATVASFQKCFSTLPA